MIGRDFAEAMRILWPEPVAAEIIGHFRHTLETGEPYYSPRFINPRHDVEIVEAYEWELHRMTLPDGQYGVICYYFDSTKLREAEAALRESEADSTMRSGCSHWQLVLGREDRCYHRLQEHYEFSASTPARRSHGSFGRSVFIPKTGRC